MFEKKPFNNFNTHRYFTFITRHSTNLRIPNKRLRPKTHKQIIIENDTNHRRYKIPDSYRFPRRVGHIISYVAHWEILASLPLYRFRREVAVVSFHHHHHRRRRRNPRRPPTQEASEASERRPWRRLTVVTFRRLNVKFVHRK